MNGKHVTPRTTGVPFAPSGRLGRGKTYQRFAGSLACYIDPTSVSPIKPPIKGITYCPPAIAQGSDGKGKTSSDAMSAAYTTKAIERASLPLPDGSMPTPELVTAMVAGVSDADKAKMAEYHAIKALPTKDRSKEQRQRLNQLGAWASRAGLIGRATRSQVRDGETPEQALTRMAESNARRLAERVASISSAKEMLDHAILLTALHHRDDFEAAWARGERADIPTVDSLVREMIATLNDESRLLIYPDSAEMERLAGEEASLQNACDKLRPSDPMFGVLRDRLANVRAKLETHVPELTPVSEITKGIKVAAILQRYSRESPPSSVGGNTARHAPTDYASKIMRGFRKLIQLGQLRSGKMTAESGRRMISSRAYPGKVYPAIKHALGVARPIYRTDSKVFPQSDGNLSDPYAQVSADVVSNIVGHVFALPNHVNATGVAFVSTKKSTEDGEALAYPCRMIKRFVPIIDKETGEKKIVAIGKALVPREYSASPEDQKQALADHEAQRLQRIKAALALWSERKATPGIPEQPATPSKGLERSKHDDLAPHRVAPATLHAMFTRKPR